MESSEGVKTFRALELRRLECMRKHQGADSEEEDVILEDMYDAWWPCTEEERDYLRAPGPYHEETVEWLDRAGVT